MLYRRERRFPPFLAALIALAVALPLGFWAGRASAPAPTLAAALAPATEAIRAAGGALDIVGFEYERALDGSEASFAAATAALAQSRANLEAAHTPLAALYPEVVGETLTQYDALASALEARAPLSDVTTALEALRASLGRLAPNL